MKLELDLNKLSLEELKVVMELAEKQQKPTNEWVRKRSPKQHWTEKEKSFLIIQIRKHGVSNENYLNIGKTLGKPFLQ